SHRLMGYDNQNMMSYLIDETTADPKAHDYSPDYAFNRIVTTGPANGRKDQDAKITIFRYDAGGHRVYKAHTDGTLAARVVNHSFYISNLFDYRQKRNADGSP